MAIEVRQATLDDEAAVAAFTADTWPERGGDYVPDVFADWVRSDGDRQRTLVATDDGEPVGLLQAVLLGDEQAWFQGMRVAPSHRGRGLAHALNDAAAAWARERGAVVARNLVFSTNPAGLGTARGVGFEPVTSVRWAHPTPDADAVPALPVVDDPDAAWAAWEGSDACAHLRGLAFAPEESWALRTLTRETLAWAADETYLGVVDDGGPRAVAFRVRDYEREDDEGVARRWAVYGVSAWDDQAACDALLADVARDAGAVGADRTRVLIPDTVAAASDAVVAGADLADEGDYVLAMDLTDAD